MSAVIVWALHPNVHGVEEHDKGGFLSLLAPLLPLLPTGLKTRPKSPHVGRTPFQFQEAIQQVSRQIVAVLEHVADQRPLFFLKKGLHHPTNHLFDWIFLLRFLDF